MLTDADRERTFYNLSVPKKLVVMFGGPVMNLILALILFGIMFVGFGTPRSQPDGELGQPMPAGSCGRGRLMPGGAPTTPRARAGVQEQDQIVALGATPVDSWDAFTAALTAQGAGATTVTVVRDGRDVVLPVTLDMVERPVVVNGEVTDQTTMRPFLGWARPSC